MNKLIFLFLALLLAACAVPPASGAYSTPAPTVTATAQPSDTPYPTAVPEPSATPVYCLVTTGYLNGTVYIRSGPGMRYPVVGYATEGELLYVQSPPVDGWAKIKTFSEVEGYFYTERWCKE